ARPGGPRRPGRVRGRLPSDRRAGIRRHPPDGAGSVPVRGGRPGGAHRRLALRVQVRRRPGQRDGLGDDDRAPPRGRPGPVRAEVSRTGTARRIGHDPLRRRGGDRRGQPGPGAGPPVPGIADRAAAPSRYPGLLPGLHLPAGRRVAWRGGRHGEHPDARRPDPAAGLPGAGAMRAGRPEPHTLAGAYALDALAGADLARFERHLARCEHCAREISEFREVTARLATAAAAEPPPGLTGRALAAAARTRQLPPATRKDAARWPARHPARTRPAGSRSRAAGLRRRAWVPRLALAVAAAATAAAVLLGVAAGTAAHRVDEQQLRGHAITAVLTAPDATMLSGRVTTGGTATIVMSRR